MGRSTTTAATASPSSACGTPTKYHWQRTNALAGESTATVTWDIVPDIPRGTYRIVHFGEAKNGLAGAISTFTGTSRPFTVS
ncbi:neutral/alkaline non-lysosomal ceramidase C-terminal domain-containing protein [Streptomyces viridiviolaceus]